MKTALIHLARSLAMLLDAYYTNYDLPTSALMISLADWVKANE